MCEELQPLRPYPHSTHELATWVISAGPLFLARVPSYRDNVVVYRCRRWWQSKGNNYRSARIAITGQLVRSHEERAQAPTRHDHVHNSRSLVHPSIRSFVRSFVSRHIDASQHRECQIERLSISPWIYLRAHVLREKLRRKAPTYTVICASISMFMYRYIFTRLGGDSP